MDLPFNIDEFSKVTEWIYLLISMGGGLYTNCDKSDSFFHVEGYNGRYYIVSGNGSKIANKY